MVVDPGQCRAGAASTAAAGIDESGEHGQRDENESAQRAECSNLRSSHWHPLFVLPDIRVNIGPRRTRSDRTEPRRAGGITGSAAKRRRGSVDHGLAEALEGLECMRQGVPGTPTPST